MRAERTTGRTLIAAALGCAVGLTLGWAIFSAPDQPQSPVVPAVTTAANIRATPTEGPTTTHGHEAEPLAPRAQAVPFRSPADGSDDAGPAREAILQTRVRELEKELARAKAAVEIAEGTPLTPPPDLPERFKQPALLDALTRALQQVNPKAEVTSVDCTEYPCIVYASGMSIEQARGLKEASGLQPYTSAGDHVSISIIDKTFAFSAMPKDDPNYYTEDADKRLTNRINAMAFAGKAH